MDGSTMTYFKLSRVTNIGGMSWWAIVTLLQSTKRRLTYIEKKLIFEFTNSGNNRFQVHFICCILSDILYCKQNKMWLLQIYFTLYKIWYTDKLGHFEKLILFHQFIKGLWKIHIFASIFQGYVTTVVGVRKNWLYSQFEHARKE